MVRITRKSGCDKTVRGCSIYREWIAYFLGALAGGPTQLWFIAPESKAEEGKVSHPIGTGPFEFVEYKTGDHIRFKKFKEYWEKGLPYVDEVLLKPIPDDIVRLTAVRSGDIDIAYRIPIGHAVELLKAPQKGFRIATDTLDGIAFICLNNSKPPFNDVRVRQAVAYGINKQEMLMGIYHGHGWVVNQMFGKGTPWYCDVAEIVQNKKKAKTLLKQAYPDGLKVTALTTRSYPYPLITCQVMQAQLKEIGMEINLEIADVPSVFRKVVPGDFEMTVMALSRYGDPDAPYKALLTPYGFAAFSHGKGYNNPKMTGLLEEAATVSDVSKRKGLYCQAVKILLDDCPIIFTTEGKAASGVRDRVKGFEQHLAGLPVYAGGGLQYTWLEK